MTPADLESLEELLARSGAGAPEDMERAVANAQGLARFIRSLVGLDQPAVRKRSRGLLGERTATASQIDVVNVNLVIGHLTRHRGMDPKLLFEARRSPTRCRRANATVRPRADDTTSASDPVAQRLGGFDRLKPIAVSSRTIAAGRGGGAEYRYERSLRR
ncbi:type I restriction-modification enzyme R subunit C-terminal domain-containing protein [Nocardia carnea]|uniref:Type I restriction-modification enzyme R subunit C-terminal domain-containing protein n=1 Tax=Nocardia carnea TaxID=37328 RepID=A0ABW7TX18_9NOCA|nr:type I restriction-modification enzyme R subunit C-terminal domain-containing protein [Nocardia carnea]